MENEKNLNENPAVQELPDEEMNKVAGGADTHSVLINKECSASQTRKIYAIYEWKGTDDNQKYLCPHCHRPVYYSGWGRYRCDVCDESWFVESSLEMNMAGGWVYIGNSTKVKNSDVPRLHGI